MFVWCSVAFAESLVAVVFIDEAARNEGYALELEDLVVDDALPIDVSEGEHVRIVDPDGHRFELDVEPGEAWEVTGAQAEAWMSRIGEDVRADVLVVRGEPDAIRRLARSLDAEVRQEKGQTLLLREGILFAAPWAEMAGMDRLDEVSPVRVETENAASRKVAVSRRAPVAPNALVVASVAPKARIAVVAPEAPSVAVDAPKAPVVPVVSQVPPTVAEVSVALDVAPAVPVADVPDSRAALDPSRYLGAWLCADGNVAFLFPGGFAAAGANGSWRVSSPGVIRLEVAGALYGRVAFGESGNCRAVWRS